MKTATARWPSRGGHALPFPILLAASTAVTIAACERPATESPTFESPRLVREAAPAPEAEVFGVVSLTGVVQSREQAAVASSHAQSEDGVMRIDNHLAVDQH